MADFIPFRGIVFNPDKGLNLTDVVTPPFDVISETQQEAFYQRHPNNVIRLILGKETANDSPQNNPHTRSAGYYNQWLSEGILKRDLSPAFYLTSVEFPFNGRTIRRFGLIGVIRLEPFEKGIVLPHERTFSRVRSERLNLMKNVHVNFSPIFGLYSDVKTGVLDTLELASRSNSDFEFDDSFGHHHCVWRLTDPELQSNITSVFRDKKIFIADGHHRYETALNYKKWVSENTPGFTDDHPANFVLMYLSGMEDPGLIILPAHRLQKQVPADRLESFPEASLKYFDIQTIPHNPDNFLLKRDEFISRLGSDSTRNTLGFYAKNRPVFYLLTPKPGMMQAMFGNELHKALIEIDVTVQTRLFFMEILGFDNDRLDNDKLIGYASAAEDAVQAVVDGKCDIACLLNPTKIEQVKRIAEAGLIMPRKATYFWPKVVTGKVFNPLRNG